jgi:secondary thiamine-phosphate synthase enzyme
MPTPVWFQHEISITAPARGCHLITNDIIKEIGTDLSKIQIGMCNLFIQHTSASLTVNENADPDVRRDLEVALNKMVPAEWNRDGTFRHTMEGDDDMPGHVKSSLMGASLNIPIKQGRLALGTWQGLYLNGKCMLSVCSVCSFRPSIDRSLAVSCELRLLFLTLSLLLLCFVLYIEHRDQGGWGGGHQRQIIVTLQGQGK